MEIKRKPGRPLKGKNKLIACWAYVKPEHYLKVRELISELIKPYR